MAVLLALTACTGDNKEIEKDPSVSAPATDPSVENPGEGTDPAPDNSDEAPSGDLTQPGATLGAGEWFTYEYETLGDGKAVISSKLIDVTKASDSQYKLLVDEIPDLVDYDVYLIQLEQKKVSGDTVEYEADYTDYTPILANGNRAQQVTVIGWDDCSTESFTPEFDTEGATLTQCFVAAAPKGSSSVPAGLQYAPFDTPFDPYDGQPAKLIKG